VNSLSSCNTYEVLQLPIEVQVIGRSCHSTDCYTNRFHTDVCRSKRSFVYWTILSKTANDLAERTLSSRTALNACRVVFDCSCVRFARSLSTISKCSIREYPPLDGNRRRHVDNVDVRIARSISSVEFD
jgi:hypothetical protein